MDALPRSSRLRRRIRDSLDDTDLQIIALLARDGRMSNREIAAQVEVTESTVGSRIRSMVERHVLGVSTIFDWEVAGYGFDCWLEITVEGRPVEEVAAQIAALDAAHTVMLVFGQVDIVVHALFAEGDDRVGFLTEQLASIAGIRVVTPQQTLRTLKYDVNYARLPLSATIPRFPANGPSLDETDLAIIEALQADGRRSNRDIARRLGVAEGTIRSRLGRLEGSRLLRICAQTDAYLTGRADAWAYVGVDVELAQTEKVIAALTAMPEVLVLAHVCAREQLLALVVAPSRRLLTELMLTKVRAVPGIRSTRTSDVIHTVRLDYHWGRLLG